MSSDATAAATMNAATGGWASTAVEPDIGPGASEREDEIAGTSAVSTIDGAATCARGVASDPESASESEANIDGVVSITADSDGRCPTELSSPLDDEDDEYTDIDSIHAGNQDNESVYAQSRYPTILAPYLVDRTVRTGTLNSSARSLYDLEFDYTFENGRRYSGSYFMPNDELEQDRMRVMHQVHLNVFDLELTTVPLENPTSILDIGTGTGEWVMGMAELYPNCEITGTDIAPLQPTSAPYNVFFEVDDAEEEWGRPPGSIDLVHLRSMSGAFADWGFIYSQAYQCLKPGGFVEVLDFMYPLDNKFFENFAADSPLFQLLGDLLQASGRGGRLKHCEHMAEPLLVGAGFTDVKIQDYYIALKPREGDPLGKLWLVACLLSFEAMSLRLLTREMGWTAERVTTVCAAICKEFRRKAFNPATNKDFSLMVRVATARKPLPPEQPTAPVAALPPALSESHHSCGAPQPHNDTAPRIPATLPRPPMVLSSRAK